MFHSTGPRIRTTMVGTMAVGAVAAQFSFSVVRAERVDPDKSKTYTCGSGTACVEAARNAIAANERSNERWMMREG